MLVTNSQLEKPQTNVYHKIFPALKTALSQWKQFINRLYNKILSRTRDLSLSYFCVEQRI